jgi:hypothetical protein
MKNVNVYVNSGLNEARLANCNVIVNHALFFPRTRLVFDARLDVI